jgi:amidohydrolase
VLALQNVLRTAIDPLHPAVISVGELSGSGAPNVTAEVARASGTLRTTHTADRDRLVERMGAAVRAIAEAHGCSGELVVRTGEPALVNDEELAVYAREWLNASDVPTGSFSSCGADDFAWYAAEVPILMIFVGARTPGPFDREPVLHDSRYLPPDETIELVAKALIAGYLAAALRTGLHAS